MKRPKYLEATTKRGLTIIELVVILASVSICAAILQPVLRSLTSVHKDRYGPTCSSNLKRVGLGFSQYAQDADEHLPPAAFKSSGTEGPARGWVDAVMPYIKSTQVFRRPQATNPNPSVTDYFFNLNLSAGDTSIISNPSALLLLGEGNDGHDLADARYARSSIPQSWITNPDSPWNRHKGTVSGGFLLFLDGHVRFWQATPQPEAPAFLFTFRPRFKHLKPARGPHSST